MIDPHSETWRTVKAAAEKGLSSARARLEMPGRGDGPSEYDRGEIAALTAILNLADPNPKPRIAPADNIVDT